MISKLVSWLFDTENGRRCLTTVFVIFIASIICMDVMWGPTNPIGLRREINDLQQRVEKLEKQIK